MTFFNGKSWLEIGHVNKPLKAANILTLLKIK